MGFYVTGIFTHNILHTKMINSLSSRERETKRTNPEFFGKFQEILEMMNLPKKPNTAEFPPVLFPLTNCGFLHFEKWKFWGERSLV
jgi:hypothetical protein